MCPLSFAALPASISVISGYHLQMVGVFNVLEQQEQAALLDKYFNLRCDCICEGGDWSVQIGLNTERKSKLSSCTERFNVF